MATLLYTQNFDSGAYATGMNRAGGCYAYSQTWVTSPRYGDSGYSMRFEIRGEDPNNEGSTSYDPYGCSANSTEIRSQTRFIDSSWVNRQAQFGASNGVWVGFAFYLPTNYPTSMDPIVWQYNGEGTGPEFHCTIENGYLRIYAGYDSSGGTNQGGASDWGVNRNILPVSSMEGQWNTFIIYRQRALTDDGNTGITKIWHNATDITDTPILNYTGPNARDYEARSGDPDVRFVIGEYVAASYITGSDDFVCLFDDVRAAAGTSTESSAFNYVDPAQGATSPSFTITFPDGFTVLDNQDGGAVYGETGTWSTYPSTGAGDYQYPLGSGNEKYVLGSGGAATATATFTIPAAGSSGLVDIYYYAQHKTDRSNAINYQLKEGASTISSGNTLSLAGTPLDSSVPEYIGQFSHDGAALSFIVDNGTTSDWVAADAIAYKYSSNSLATIGVLLNKLAYTGGTDGGAAVPAIGDTVEGDTSGATATILAIEIDSGTFEGDDAAGTLYFGPVTGGPFESGGETVSVSTGGDVTTSGSESSAVSLVQSSDNTDTTTSITIPVPGGGTTDSLYQIHVVSCNDGPSGENIITVPTGWTEVCPGLDTSAGEDFSERVMYKFYDSDSGNFTVTTSTAQLYAATCWVTTNVNTSSPIDVSDSSHSNSQHILQENQTAVVQGALTTVSNNACVFSLSHLIQSTYAASAITTNNGNAVEMYEHLASDDDVPNMYGTYELMTSAGAATSETQTYTFTDFLGDGSSIRYALAPAPTTVDLVVSDHEFTGVAKNSASVEYDLSSYVSGGTSTYNLDSVDNITGFIQTDLSVASGSALTVNAKPNIGFDGNAQFRYHVSDSSDPVQSASAVITIPVSNTAPTGSNGTISVEAGETRYFNLLDVGGYTDTEGDSGTAELVTSAPGGSDPCTLTMENSQAESDGFTLKVVAGSVVETQNSATYRFNDGSNTNPYSPEYTLTIKVVAPPVIPVDPPIINDTTRTCVGTKSFQFKVDLTQRPDGTAYSDVFINPPTVFKAAEISSRFAYDDDGYPEYTIVTSVHTFTVDGNSPSSGIAEGTLGQLLLTPTSSFRGTIYFATYAGNDVESEWVGREFNVINPISTPSPSNVRGVIDPE